MAVGGELLVAGQYTCNYNGAHVGIFQGDQDVPSIRATPKGKPVNNTDRYGYAKVDSVHMGYDYVFEGVLMEYAKALALLNPFGVFGTQGVPGLMKYLYAKPLVLTVVNNGTTAVGNPNVLVAAKSIIAEDFDARLFYGPILRVVPIKMDLFPSVIVGLAVANFTMA